MGKKRICLVGFPESALQVIDYDQQQYSIETLPADPMAVMGDGLSKVLNACLTVFYPTVRTYMPFDFGLVLEDADKDGFRAAHFLDPKAKASLDQVTDGLSSSQFFSMLFNHSCRRFSALFDADADVMSGASDRLMIFFDPVSPSNAEHENHMAAYFLKHIFALAEAQQAGRQSIGSTLGGAFAELEPYDNAVLLSDWAGETTDERPDYSLSQHTNVCEILRDSNGSAHGGLFMKPGLEVALLPHAKTLDEVLSCLGPLLRRMDVDGAGPGKMECVRSTLARRYSPTDPAAFPIVGKSLAMYSFLKRLLAAGLDDAGHVLIVGETGTGKRLAGEVLHKISRRRNEPLQSLNCAAAGPRAYAQLFGSGEEGAAGSAISGVGLFGKAEKGTLLLEHVHALDSVGRNALAQHLRPGPAGAGDRGRADGTRVVATTSRTDFLHEEDVVASGLVQHFAHVIVAPPLRCRREDISLFTEAFLGEMTSDFPQELQHRLRTDSYSDGGLSREWLVRDWRNSNVRGLKAAVRNWVYLNVVELGVAETGGTGAEAGWLADEAFPGRSQAPAVAPLPTVAKPAAAQPATAQPTAAAQPATTQPAAAQPGPAKQIIRTAAARPAQEAAPKPAAKPTGSRQFIKPTTVKPTADTAAKPAAKPGTKPAAKPGRSQEEARRISRFRIPPRR